MNLKYQLLKEHTRANCDLMIDWIGKDQKRFKELLELFLADNYRITQRAAWPLCEAAILHPLFLKNHFKTILQNLKKDNIHDGVKRNATRLFQEINIPEEFEGEIMDICFNYVLHPTETVAVKDYSLGVLEKLAEKYPEIIPELKLIIRDQMPYQTSGFKSRGRKILAKFD